MLKFTDSDYVHDPVDFLRAFSSKLDLFENEHPKTNTGDWTKAVQASLKQLASDYDQRIEHLSSPGTTVDGTGEFLLDAVWWRRIVRTADEHIALAVESEFAGWVRDRQSVAREVLKDFEKLLVMKSPLKLMIFCSVYQPNDKNLSKMRETVWSTLRQSILQYSHHIEGEKYLFVDTAVKGERNAWIVTIPCSGKLTSDQLEEERVELA